MWRMVYCKEGLCLDPGTESFLIGNSVVRPLDQKIAEVLLYIYIYYYIYFIISNEQSIHCKEIYNHICEGRILQRMIMLRSSRWIDSDR